MRNSVGADEDGVGVVEIILILVEILLLDTHVNNVYS